MLSNVLVSWDIEKNKTDFALQTLIESREKVRDSQGSMGAQKREQESPKANRYADI